MSLIETLEDIQRQLTSTLQRLKKPVPLYAFGEHALDVEDAPPRIVWVPTGGPVGSVDALGGGVHASQLGDGATSPGPLWGRRLTVEAHIWASGQKTVFQADQQRSDIAAAEALGRHLVAATHAMIYGSYAVVSERWITATVSNLGVVWILGIVIRMPFTREDDTFSLPIVDFPITPQIIDPMPTG